MDDRPSIDLFRDAQRGDADALDRLLRRWTITLRRWAHGRLYRAARGIRDTQDLVQDALIQTLKHLPRLRFDNRASLLAYVKTALRNGIKNEVRTAHRRPPHAELGATLSTGDPSPLDAAIVRDDMARYQRALARLSKDERRAVVARLEWGLTDRELAAVLRKPSVAAARMAATRAIRRLTRLMGNRPQGDERS